MAVQYARDVGPDYAEIANQLNDEWDEFGMQFDPYQESMDPKSSSSIRKAIDDWQNWYYGNYDQWPDPSNWYYVLEKAKAILAVELQKEIASVEVDPYAGQEYALTEEPVDLPTEYIYGKVPKFDIGVNGADPFANGKSTGKKSGIPWGLIVIGGILALAIASKKKR